jgi:hypothetical protein
MTVGHGQDGQAPAIVTPHTVTDATRAGGRTRTDTPSREGAFETPESTISPLRQSRRLPRPSPPSHTSQPAGSSVLEPFWACTLPARFPQTQNADHEDRRFATFSGLAAAYCAEPEPEPEPAPGAFMSPEPAPGAFMSEPAAGGVIGAAASFFLPHAPASSAEATIAITNEVFFMGLSSSLSGWSTFRHRRCR